MILIFIKKISNKIFKCFEKLIKQIPIIYDTKSYPILKVHWVYASMNKKNIIHTQTHRYVFSLYMIYELYFQGIYTKTLEVLFY